MSWIYWVKYTKELYVLQVRMMSYQCSASFGSRKILHWYIAQILQKLKLYVHCHFHFHLDYCIWIVIFQSIPAMWAFLKKMSKLTRLKMILRNIKQNYFCTPFYMFQYRQRKVNLSTCLRKGFLNSDFPPKSIACGSSYEKREFSIRSVTQMLSPSLRSS